jgi:DNA-directed RNA polymerase subunit RPC12/RpoP
MTTTLEKFAGAKRHNYCTLPTIDVEILDDPTRCATCDDTLYLVPDRYGLSRWTHSHGDNDQHYARALTRCTYCGTQDPAEVEFVQASYSDETRCTRCGGVNGYGIGD